MASKNGFKRKRVLIDRDFQFKYLITWIAMTMVLLGGLVLASVSMFFLFKVRTFNHLVIGNAVCAVLITILSMRYMIHLSHRIAGSAFRLERTIREMADGKHSGHIKLRKKDYLKHIAESVNYLIDRLEESRRESGSPTESELDETHTQDDGDGLEADVPVETPASANV